MSKDEASIPLNDLNSPAPATEIKPDRAKKPYTKSFNFKLLFAISIFILILLLIIILTIVILRSYQAPCSPQMSTAKPKSTYSPRVRIPNKYWNEYHLPGYVKPIHYELTLQILNVRNDTFYGFVKMYVQINSPSTNFVVLHADNLTIQSIVIKHQDSDQVTIKETIYDDYYFYMILVLDKQLRTGENYTIEIRYSGIITPDSSGVIRTVYNDVFTKQQYYLLYSKLEPIGARKMFPCFDEPDKKVTFTVHLIHNQSHIALSNMPLWRNESLNISDLLFPETRLNHSTKLVISKFKPSKIPMSIYLLAFVLVENYNHISFQRQTDKTVSIWFPNDLNDSAKIPLNYATATENFFETYFNYSSPLPKSDHVYLPDFLSGAMENWGLITYRDRHLLVSETQTAYQSKSSLMTIAHELAHYWFGNLVTTTTWGEIWLNEGFATYFASYAYYHQMNLPDTKSEELYLYERRQVIPKDTRSNLSAVIVNVTNPRMYKSVFNAITYQKGQVLLVWLESIMGQFGFLKAIKNYITKFATKNPTTEEFFDCVDEIGHEKNFITMPKLKIFFKPWLYRGGYPVVMVNYDLKKMELILTQKSVIKNSSSLDIWPIYTTYKTSSVVDDSPVFFEDRKIINQQLNDDEFVVFNSNGKSYLRVNYSELLWDRIINELNSTSSKISQISKIILLDDAFHFTETSSINFTITKRLIDTFENEINTIPWLLFYYKIFDRFHDFFKDDVSFINFSNRVINLSKKMFQNTLNIKADDELNLLDDINQRAIFTMNCEAGNDKALNWVSDRFLAWIKNPPATKLPKHLVQIILFYGMRRHDKTVYWNQLWMMLKDKNYGVQLSLGQLAIGLAGTSKPSRLNKLLDNYLVPYSHRSSHEKQQDFMNLVEWMMKSTNGFVVLQRWVLKKSDKIMKFCFGDNLSEADRRSVFENLLIRLAKTIYEPHMISPLYKLHSFKELLRNTVVHNNNWRENVGKKLIKLF